MSAEYIRRSWQGSVDYVVWLGAIKKSDRDQSGTEHALVVQRFFEVDQAIVLAAYAPAVLEAAYALGGDIAIDAMVHAALHGGPGQS
jgi:hypothetical protein